MTDVMVKGKSKPAVVNKYNYAMNGCHWVDQVLPYYGKGKSFPIGCWKSDSTMHMFYRPYCLSRPADVKHKSMLQFKEQLIDGLLNLVLEIMPQDVRANGDAPAVGSPRTSLVLECYLGNIHLISFSGGQKKCVHCGSSRSQFFCKGCRDKHCFEQYHTP
ncbi:hypothetical protein PoB_002145100 [Plakobranchus ocellatus]|uniref:PiggyBac transposable element-derived protein domain-containing protein n=1 Tax=Plakobranchus ocellatus TaxID=259542 RepID=A0AAV3ZK90_9GAST|nr:hypothetical protein PoB_002145100 [Plakobranchus ocellatus]